MFARCVKKFNERTNNGCKPVNCLNVNETSFNCLLSKITIFKANLYSALVAPYTELLQNLTTLKILKYLINKRLVKSFQLSSITASSGEEFLSNGEGNEMLTTINSRSLAAGSKNVYQNPGIQQERFGDEKKKKWKIVVKCSRRHVNCKASDFSSLIGREWQRNVQKRKKHAQRVRNYIVKYETFWQSCRSHSAWAAIETFSFLLIFYRTQKTAKMGRKKENNLDGFRSTKLRIL